MKIFQLMMLAIAVTLAPGSDGPQPNGMLIYTRDGHMSVQLMFAKSANAQTTSMCW